VIVPAVAVNVLVVDPAATVTEAGTVNNPLLLDSVMPSPPAGAAADSVTVQVEVPLLPRLVTVQPKELRRTGAVSEKFAVLVLLLYVAVMVALWLLLIVPAVAVNVLVVDPAATVTEAGTVNSALLLDSVTDAPPAGAAEESVTVQVEVPPLAKLVVVQPKELSNTGAVSDSVDVVELLLYVAVIVPLWLLGMVPAVAVKVLVVDPAATVTEAGTVNSALLLDSVTDAPPAGAACERVTVQVDAAALTRLAGLQVKLLTVVVAVKEMDAC